MLPIMHFPNDPPAQLVIEQKDSDRTIIGQATMLPDGTIVLDSNLRTNQAIAEERVIYKPSNSKYRAVLKQIGGLHPGEVKPVRPWDDKISPP